MTVRTVMVWCPDWPVTASGHSGGAPVAVVRANQVVAASRAARAEGVRPGQRRRQAESACAGLMVVDQDPDREARVFEPVVRAVSTFCPLVEVVRSGLCGFGARGPARYFGGEEALVDQVARAVDAVTGGEPCRIGVADGPFAARLAARRGRIVPPGKSPEFLAPLSVRELGRPEMADLLERLGVRTLGQLAALPAPQFLSRFGWEGAAVHRLAQGRDDRPLDATAPPKELSVQEELDPPVDRLDVAAFVAKSLADRLYALLKAGNWRCTLVRIEAESEHGEFLSRAWRHDGSFTSATLGERVRWQLDGWLSGPDRPTGGILRLSLVPDEVAPDDGVQESFWGGLARADAEAARVLGRVQAQLGPEGVLVAVLEGGRGPGERSRLVPWGDERLARRGPNLPWPGRLPPPAPAVVRAGAAAAVLDDQGRLVKVSRRGELLGVPAGLELDGRAAVEVTGWSAPWPAEERWWDPEHFRRRVWMQVTVADDRGLLLSAEQGQWTVEAIYD